MLCCFVVLAMTTVWVAPSSSGIIPGEEKRGWEPRRDKTRGMGMIRGSRGSGSIITAITEVCYLKLWLHNECKNSAGVNSSCFNFSDNMRTRGCCISAMDGINLTTIARRPAKPHLPRKSLIATFMLEANELFSNATTQERKLSAQNKCVGFISLNHDAKFHWDVCLF